MAYILQASYLNAFFLESQHSAIHPKEYNSALFSVQDISEAIALRCNAITSPIPFSAKSNI